MTKIRLAVYRSNKHIYGQIIDDAKGQTLAAASDLALDKKPATRKARNKTEDTEISVSSKTNRARLVGQLLAEKALKKGVREIVFDRGRCKYHGRIKALAEGAREGGLKF